MIPPAQIRWIRILIAGLSTFGAATIVCTAILYLSPKYEIDHIHLFLSLTCLAFMAIGNLLGLVVLTAFLTRSRRRAVIGILVCAIPLANCMVINRQKLWADDQREESRKARSPAPQTMESFAEAVEQMWDVTKRDGLEPVWSIDGDWWSVANDVLGTRIPQVLTTASGGKVHIFGQDGKKIKVLDPGFHATLVRTTNGSKSGKPGAILVGGKMMLASLNGEGEKNWSVELPFRGPTAIKEIKPNIVYAQVAIGHPWLALGGDWGDVCVVDTVTGNIIGHVNGQGRSQVCWAKAEKDGESLLIVGTQKAVNAFRVAR